MRTGRPVLVVLGASIGFIGLALAAVSVALLWAHGTQRDADGFYLSPPYRLMSDSHAIIVEDIDLVSHPGDWSPATGGVTLRVVAAPAENGAGLFVGVGPNEAVASFLAGVDHEQVTRVEGDQLVYQRRPGGQAPPSPADPDLWVANASGVGTQTLDWDAQPGSWALVLMRPDGSLGLDATVHLGVRAGFVLPFAGALLIGGLILFGVAAVLLVVGTRPVPPAQFAADPPSNGPPHPLTLAGRLDPQLSRWRWLVKWVLALPHVAVLTLLWAAVLVLTVVAGVTILVTGRYPRAIFDFNVGVVRWTWRVSYYAFGVLGTDRYPPFSLAHDDAYPTTLEVAYPERLSRGLVLVKWWLLALPHHVIVAVLTGGLVSWRFDFGGPDGWQVVLGTGLIGVLVAVAALVLLVSSRYPPGLYDLVLGLQRWVYRVGVYALLMTDTYPPFRLDTGGPDPTAAARGPDWLPPDTPAGAPREPAGTAR